MSGTGGAAGGHRPDPTVDDPAEADLAILLAAAMSAVSERLLAAVHASGTTEMRQSYGFVIRAVSAEQPTVNRLAERLGVTKQSVSRLVDDMERDGLVERVVVPEDRRARRLHLTAKGAAVRRTAMSTSASIEAELRDAVGADAVAGARAVLTALVDRAGRLDDLEAKRARPTW